MSIDRVKHAEKSAEPRDQTAIIFTDDPEFYDSDVGFSIDVEVNETKMAMDMLMVGAEGTLHIVRGLNETEAAALEAAMPEWISRKEVRPHYRRLREEQPEERKRVCMYLALQLAVRERVRAFMDNGRQAI